MIEEVIGVIQIQVQKMIDIGLEVEIVLEIGLEVEEDLSRPVLIATSQNMSCLTVIDYQRPEEALFRKLENSVVLLQCGC